MGGSGSGRWGSRKPVVEAFRRLDIAQFCRESPIDQNAYAVDVSFQRNGIREQARIELTSTRPFLGGRRFLFVCPGCSGRARILYVGSRRIACWRCHKLRYRTQIEGRDARELRGMQKIARRLDPESDDIWLPDKPPRMHWRTYDRWVERYEAYDVKWATSALRRIGGLRPVRP